MKINNNYYPYPTISDFSDDYINSVFNVEYKNIQKGFKNNIINVKFDLEDEELNKLIKEKKIKMVVHIECSNTSYRDLLVLPADKKDIDIEIYDTHMRHKMELTGLLIANEKIETYENKNFNSEIYGENYIIRNLERGSILGVTTTQEIEILSDNNDFENISSIIKVASAEVERLIVDIDSDIVNIKLPADEYNMYCNLSQTGYSSIIMSAIILPSLVYVLDEISKGDIDIDLDWYNSIVKKLEANNIEIIEIGKKYSTIELAQMILEDPIEKGLKDIENILERDDS